MAYSDGVFQKNISQKFVADLYDYLENQTGTPKSKFYSLIVLLFINLGTQRYCGQKRY